MSDRPKIIAVDFDGTIVENAFPSIGPINYDIVAKLRKEKKEGAVIILWTTRQNESLEEAIDFMNVYDIPFDYVNKNADCIDFDTSRKIFADIYLDDRAENPFYECLEGKVKLSSEAEVSKRYE